MKQTHFFQHLPILIFLLLFFLPKQINGQSQNEQRKNGDMYFSKATISSKLSIDSTIHFLILAEEAYVKASSWEGLIKTQVKIGDVYLKKRNDDKAITYFQKAIETSSEHGNINQLMIGATYHKLGRVFDSKQKWTDALYSYEQALKIRKQVLETDHLDIGKTSNNLGKLYSNFFGDSKTGLDYYQEALRIKLIHLGENGVTVWNSLVGVSKCYFNLGEFEQAISFAERAVKVAEKLLEKDNSPYSKNRLAGSLNNLALMYIDLYKVEKAIPILQRTNIIWKKMKNVKGQLLFYNNMGRAYANIGDFQRSKLYYSRSLELSEIAGKGNELSIANAYTGIGFAYHQGEDNFEKAIDYYQKDLDLKRMVLTPNNHDIGNQYANIALCYTEIKDFEKAEKYYNNAQEIYNHNNLFPWSFHINKAVFFNAKGNFEAAKLLLINRIEEERYKKNKNQRTISKLELALYDSYLGLGQKTEAFHILSNLKERLGQVDVYKNYNLESLYLSTLGKEAFFLMDNYKALGITKQEGLDKALINFQQLIQKAELLRIEYKSIVSKKHFMNKYYTYFEGGLKAAYELFNLTKEPRFMDTAFELIEKSKIGLMRESITSSNAKAIAGISKEWAIQEENLLNEITLLDEKLNAELIKKEKRNSLMIVELSKKIDLKKLALYNFIELTENKYPKYFQLKFNNATIPLTKVQNKILEDNQSILEYFVGENNIFVLVLNKEDVQFYRIENTNELQQWVKSMLACQTKSGMLDTEKFTASAYQLYQAIIKPIKDHLKENLIIIPDGFLSKIPFEALITTVPSKNRRFKTHAYLIREHCISYNLSAFMLFYNKNASSYTPSLTSLSLAPFVEQDSFFTYKDEDFKSETRTGFGPLQYSGEEIAYISQLTKGDAYLGNLATEHLLKIEAAQYNILHLATHGSMDEKNRGFLAFKNSKDSLNNGMLFLSEIYNLSLQNEMTVLSACESGIGMFQKGEGTLSLARAFLVAGSKSVVNTLWKVNDKQTKAIIIDFYYHLDKGLSRTKALQKAKLNYLAQHPHSIAHPYFWSGIILIGKNAPLSIK